jgi:hypothetical protein
MMMERLRGDSVLFNLMFPLPGAFNRFIGISPGE